MSDSFAFFDPGKLVDGDLELALAARVPADPSRGYVPYHEFEMRQPGSTGGRYADHGTEDSGRPLCRSVQEW